jgi:hypothetical protein
MSERHPTRGGPLEFIIGRVIPYIREHPLIVGLLVADAIGFLILYLFVGYLMSHR